MRQLTPFNEVTLNSGNHLTMDKQMVNPSFLYSTQTSKMSLDIKSLLSLSAVETLLVTTS